MTNTTNHVEGWLWRLSISAHWTQSCTFCIRGCYSPVGFRRFAYLPFFISILSVVFGIFFISFHALIFCCCAGFGTSGFLIHLSGKASWAASLCYCSFKWIISVLCILASIFFFSLYLDCFTLKLLAEFDQEEFREAKVDPIYQFSKPVAVQFLLLCPHSFHCKVNAKKSLLKRLFLLTVPHEQRS